MLNSKLKAVAAGVALASMALTAQADINNGANGSTGNGELFLSVWDVDGEVSYSLDLNVDFNSIADNPSQSWSVDLADFGYAGGGDQFSVAANNVTDFFTGYPWGFMTTSPGDLAAMNAAMLGNEFSVYGSAQQSITNYINAINSATGGADYGTHTSGTSYHGTDIAWNGNMGGQFAFGGGTDGVVDGGSINLYRFGIDPNTGNADNSLMGVFQMAGSVLSYNPGASNPVPVPAAAWLMLSGIIGMAGISRRKKA